MIITLLIFITGHAAEVATSKEVGAAAPTRASADLKAIYRCYQTATDMDRSDAFTHKSRTFCSYNWISPGHLPAKFQKAYQIFPDRIDVYDLSNLKGSVDGLNRQVMSVKTDSCYDLNVPPADGPGLLTCIERDCPESRPGQKLAPAHSIRVARDAGEVTEAMRDGIYPVGISTVLGEMARYAPTNPDRVAHLKALVCDCGKAGVLDGPTVGKIRQMFRTRASRPGIGSAEADELKKVGEDLDACSAAVS